LLALGTTNSLYSTHRSKWRILASTQIRYLDPGAWIRFFCPDWPDYHSCYIIYSFGKSYANNDAYLPMGEEFDMANREFDIWDVNTVLTMVAEEVGTKKIHGSSKWGKYVKAAIEYVLLGKGERPEPLPLSHYGTAKERSRAERSVPWVRECLRIYLKSQDVRATPEIRERLAELPTSAEGTIPLRKRAKG
jgi:hypothetical protein